MLQQKYTHFSKDIRRNGNRLTVSGALPIFTMPEPLLVTILKRNDVEREDFDLILDLFRY